MGHHFDIGQTVLVKLPTYLIHRRAVINSYNELSDVYSVTMLQTGAKHEIVSTQIKELSKPKSKKTMENNTEESQISSTTESLRTRTRKLVNLDEDFLESTSPSPQDCSPNIPEEILESNDVTISNRSYITFIGILYTFFGFISLILVSCCFTVSCESFKSSIHISAAPLIDLLDNFHLAFIPLFTLVSIHLISFILILKSGFRSRIIDSCLPLLLGAIAYFTKQTNILTLSFIFDYIKQLMLIYLFLSGILLMISLFNPILALSYESYVFFEQHSVLLSIIVVMHQALYDPYSYVENLSFYYFFFLGYVLTACLRILPQNSRRVNFISTLFARPFLLTVPIISAISKVTSRWNIVFYVFIFLIYTLCLVLQLEPYRSDKPSRFLSNFLQSITKLCMASLAGLKLSSLTAWIAVFLVLVIDHLL